MGPQRRRIRSLQAGAASGVYTFTVELVKGGGVFRGGRIRWCAQYVDAKNYLLFELDKKTFWAEVIEKGKKLERQKTQHQSGKRRSRSRFRSRSTPEHVVHKIKTRRTTG